MRISRSGFVKRIHHLSSGIFSWFGADNRLSVVYIATEFRVSTMFPSSDAPARATPSLQWVPWPLLAGALRFPTFIGNMGFYDCSRPIRNPSGRPLGHVPPLLWRKSGALFGSWAIPVEHALG